MAEKKDRDCVVWQPQTLKGHLHYKMLLLQSVHVCTPWSNSFCTGFARFAHASPAHLIGSPNPLVSRAPQKASFFFARSGKLECDQSFFLRQNGSDQASSETRLSLRASSNPRSLKEAHSFHVFACLGRCHISSKMKKRDTPAFFLVFGRYHSTSKTVSLNTKNGEA